MSSGVTNLVLLKTTDSAFTDFARDQFTTLSDTTDRILATAVTGLMGYRTGMISQSAIAFGRHRRNLCGTTAVPSSTHSTQWLKPRSTSVRTSPK